ncbi:MAG: glycosyltransferase [Prevotellaceae bacterium]|nr:glycosyltransferase [Candidatus Colivivens equi]
MKLSIITVNYNGAEGLQKTLNSVSQQSFTDFELIVIDGGSTDESIEVIKEYESLFAHRPSPIAYRWVSERDKGIYDGMNKGVKMASGEYVYFLNGGDTFMSPDSVINMFAVGKTEDILVGRLNYIDGRGRYHESYQKKMPYQSMLGFIRTGIPHQSAFIKKSLFDKCGLYDLNYKVAADWQFFMRAIGLYGASVAYCDVLLAHFDNGGLTSKRGDLMAQDINNATWETIPVGMLGDYGWMLQSQWDLDKLMWIQQHKLAYFLFKALGIIGRKLCK